jgi:hypothetical protein
MSKKDERIDYTLSARDEIKKTIPNNNNELVWTVNMKLDPTEQKGPFILAISQPLKYNVDEAGQPALIPEAPASGEELIAIIGKIEQRAQLTVIFCAGLNAHRYAAIKSLSSVEVKSVKTTEEIFEEAQTLALEDEKKSVEAHKNYFQVLQTQNPGFKFCTLSELMENPQCVALIKTVRDEYKSGKSKKLTRSINSYAERATEADIIFYSDILRAAKSGKKFYSSTDNSVLSELEIKQKFVDAAKEHGLQEFALYAYLVKEHQSKCILQKGAVKKHPTKKSNLKKTFFSMHAPGLINLILREFIEHTTEKQCKVRYKEYLLEQHSPAQPFPKPELLVLFHVIAALPQYLYGEGFQEVAFTWYLVAMELDKKISKALMETSSEQTIKKFSFFSEQKTKREKQIPLDLPSDFDSLISWMGKFMALISIYHNGPAITKISTLVFSNVSRAISFKICQIAIKSLSDIKNYHNTLESNFKNAHHFTFESHSKDKIIPLILDESILSHIFSSS